MKDLATAGLQAESKKRIRGHSDLVCSVAISRDRRLVCSGSLHRTVRLWNPRAGHQNRPLFEGHTDEVHCVSFSPDEPRVVSGSRDKTLSL